MIKFSIIVPTCNRYELLKKNIENIIDLDYPKDQYEIIVVNNTIEDDDTQEYLTKLARRNKTLRVYKEIRLGPSFARNKGILKAKYSHIILIDDDIEVTPTLLLDFYKAWSTHPNAVAIGGEIYAKPVSGNLTPSQKKILSQHTWVFGKQYKGKKEYQIPKGEMLTSGTLGVYQKFKSKLFFNTNLGFCINDETIIYGEDSELCNQILIKDLEIWYCPQIVTTNYFNKERLTKDYLSKRYFTNGIEIFILDSLIKNEFPFYDFSYKKRLLRAVKRVLIGDMSLFKNFMRTRYDFIMIFSYFFCGKYFMPQYQNIKR